MCAVYLLHRKCSVAGSVFHSSLSSHYWYFFLPSRPSRSHEPAAHDAFPSLPDAALPASRWHPGWLWLGFNCVGLVSARHQTPASPFCAVKGKVLRESSWENKVANHFTNVIKISFEDNQKDFSWITYCFYLTQTSTTCLSPCQLPYVAPNCCVIWTAFCIFVSVWC